MVVDIYRAVGGSVITEQIDRLTQVLTGSYGTKIYIYIKYILNYSTNSNGQLQKIECITVYVVTC